MLSLDSPARHIRRPRPLHEQDRGLDEFVAERAAADDSVVAMIPLARCDGDAGTMAAVNGLGHEAVRGGVIMSLKMAADLIVMVAQTERILIAFGIEKQPRRFD